MMSDRVPTGSKELDSLIEGGFLQNSTILLTGCPGSGKTILSAKFIYEGAVKYGEPGVYVCLAESKRMFMKEMLEFGLDFEALIRKNQISILDLSIAAEIDIQSSLNRIISEITNLRAKRLVIDSITALFMGLKDNLEKRHLIRLIYKLIQKSGCTTIMIVDRPWGSDRIGNGIEEFIADGIILMQNYYDEKGNLRRQIRILKMRATNHALGTYEYSIGKRGVEIKVKVD